MWRRRGRHCVSNGDSERDFVKRAKVSLRSAVWSDRTCSTANVCLPLTASTNKRLQPPIRQNITLTDDRKCRSVSRLRWLAIRYLRGDLQGAVVETGKFLWVSRKKNGKWLYTRAVRARLTQGPRVSMRRSTCLPSTHPFLQRLMDDLARCPIALARNGPETLAFVAAVRTTAG